MIDNMILPVALTAAVTAVTIVIRGLPPSGKVSLLRYCPNLNPSSNLIIRPKLPNLSQSELDQTRTRFNLSRSKMDKAGAWSNMSRSEFDQTRSADPIQPDPNWTRPGPDLTCSDQNWTRSGQMGLNSIFSNVPSIILWILLHAWDSHRSNCRYQMSILHTSLSWRRKTCKNHK